MRQKIYYVANARMPTEKAHGIQIAKMCEALIEAGADVELIVPRRGRDERALQEFYGLRVAIPVRYVWTPDWYGAGRMGFFISSLAFMFGYAGHLWRKKIRGSEGIIWAIDIDQFSFFCIPFLGMPYLAEIHDAKPWSVPFFFLTRGARMVVVINTLIKEKIEEVFHIPSERIAVHPNGSDPLLFSGSLSRADARLALGIGEEKKIALYAGQFYAWKGLGIVSAAAADAPDILFYLVGGDEKEYVRVAGTAPVPNMVFAGHRPYQEMPRWLAASDALLVLGTTTEEYSYLHTSPMKLFEYMASRRAIIAADTPANREIVSDAEAFFYAPDDPAALARAVAYAFSHPEDARAKIEAAGQKASKYTWDRRAQEILSRI